MKLNCTSRLPGASSKKREETKMKTCRQGFNIMTKQTNQKETKMKQIKATLTVIVLCVATSAFAQTNTNSASPTLIGGIEIIGQALLSATNWTVTTGYGHGLKNNGNIAFADLAYNFNENVGVVVGFDQRGGGGQSQFNDIRGGITLSLPMRPFKVLGGTNFLTKLVATPFVADLLATPRSGDSIGNLIVTGAKVDLWNIGNFNLGLLGAYEHR